MTIDAKMQKALEDGHQPYVADFERAAENLMSMLPITDKDFEKQFAPRVFQRAALKRDIRVKKDEVTRLVQTLNALSK